ncbi:MAG: hypothetical protein KGI19_02525 [Thaumarchaeota archaeon]|nr:hypothetical protein [Nitrososphaerota archaeon]MDE1817465.1 hypothetical protein [Nitrososphaerota archaeon]
MKLLIGAIFGFLMLLLPSLTLQTSQGTEWNQTLVPEENVVVEKSIVSMYIPGDSKLPFGCVWGTVQNPAPGYPVEIEIYQNGKPVYVAQTNVNSDGSYQHYFRVKSVEGDKVIHIFEGNYTVDIFKSVVKSTPGTTST